MSTARSKNGIVLGLVGPVCAGKSQVAAQLRALGAEIYEADAIVRGLYDHADVKQSVRELFGNGVIDAKGSINRKAIADRVFQSHEGPELLRKLTEGIIFPRTGVVIRARIEQFRASAGPRDVLVVDAPTLFEAGRADWCDQILFVSAPTERRQDWAASRGWSADDLTRRDAAMIPESEKRRRANHVIENIGSPADLNAAVERVWNSIRAENT